MKLLLTGFDPFGGEACNPSYEALKLLPDEIEGAEVVTLELPTVFGKAGDALEAEIEACHPDVVLCIGQAGGRSAITVEKVAINLRDARIPDNSGAAPVDEPVRPDGPSAYFSNLPVKAMVEALREHGIPAFLSYSAGTFVCNDLMYTLLYLIDRKYPALRGGFLHVPYSMEQAVSKPSGTPSMALEQIVAGLTWAVRAIVRNKGDGDAPSAGHGALH